MSKQIVLLLDDEEHIRKDLGKYLEKNGYAVFRASSVEEAQKIILSEKIDFAIVDLQIDYKSGEYGGAQIANYVKRIHPTSKTIILSAHPSTPEIMSKINTFVDGYITKGGQDNYIRSVLNKMKEFIYLQVRKRCFVIMPFSSSKTCTEEEWTYIFDSIIKPFVEEAGFNYECIRSQPVIGNIIEDILDELNKADLVIADLTDRNPNVFYELGVRNALRNATILISQNREDVPFDLIPYATFVYGWKIDKD